MQTYDMSAILGAKPLDHAEIESLNAQIVTNALLSVHVTPVDATPEGDGILRYDSMSKATES